MRTRSDKLSTLTVLVTGASAAGCAAALSKPVGIRASTMAIRAFDISGLLAASPAAGGNHTIDLRFGEKPAADDDCGNPARIPDVGQWVGVEQH